MPFNVSMIRLTAALDFMTITSFLTGYHKIRQKTSEKTMEIWLVLWYDKKSDSQKRRDSHAAAPGG